MNVIPTHPLTVARPGGAQTFAQQSLAIAYAAYLRSMNATSLGKGDRSLERVDPEKARTELRYWEQQVLAEQGQSSNGGIVYASFDPTY